MITILYLNPEGSASLIGPLSEVKSKVESHPLTIEYTLEEFVEAFNHSDISHLGYITLKNVN